MYEYDNDFIKSDTPAGPARRPQSLSELDVRHAVLEDIALKILYLSGSVSVLQLAEKLCLSYEIVDALFGQLRAEQLCLVTGMTGHVHQIAITSQGRTRAMELLAHNHYAGAAPVAFDSYVDADPQTERQKG